MSRISAPISLIRSRLRRALGAALSGTGTAHAYTDNERNYLFQLGPDMLQVPGSDGDKLKNGYVVCDYLRGDGQPLTAVNALQRRFYTNSLGGSHIPITNGQASILVNDAIGTYCPGSQGAIHWHAQYFPTS